jgi:hypothetical protein
VIDEATVQHEMARQQAEDDSRRGGGVPFIKVIGPHGQVKWGPEVPVGYVGEVIVWICGPAEGRSTPWAEIITHFVKTTSYPNGIVLPCSGDDNCKFCAARGTALESPDPNINEKAAQWGRKRVQSIYNAFNLHLPTSHVGQDQIMRPHLLGASPQLQGDLRKLFNARTVAGVVDYTHGRPVKITKAKTGVQNVNIEWGAIDCDPQPLDAYFWPGTYNLHDLAKQQPSDRPEILFKVIQELGWTMPGGLAPTHQVPAGYQQQPPPPHQSPYQAPPQAAPGTPVQANVQPPVHQPPPAGYPPQQMPPVGQPPQYQQPPAAPPQYQQPAAAPAPAGAPSGNPPPPPQVQSTVGAAAPPAPPPPPAMGSAPPAAAPAPAGAPPAGQQRPF